MRLPGWTNPNTYAECPQYINRGPYSQDSAKGSGDKVGFKQTRSQTFVPGASGNALCEPVKGPGSRTTVTWSLDDVSGLMSCAAQACLSLR